MQLQPNLVTGYLCLSILRAVIYKQIDSAVKKIWNKKCGYVKKMRWGNFVNFPFTQKQDDFHQYKYCYCITKVQNG